MGDADPVSGRDGRACRGEQSALRVSRRRAGAAGVAAAYLGGWPFAVFWALAAAAVLWEWTTLVAGPIHGVALGGGFQIALGADIRYVAPDSRLAIMEIKWGIVPDMAGIALMRELARADVIRELAMTGRIFSGTEALAYGFATSLHADPLAAARSTAKEIAARNPEAVRAIKRLLNTATDADAATILLAESKEQAALIGSPNQIEAVRAGMEGRPGRFAD